MFRKEYFRRIRKGLYVYRDKIKVYKAEDNSCWVIKDSEGVIKFIGIRLNDCKYYLGKEYD